MYYHLSTALVYPTQPSPLSNQWFSQTCSHPHTDGCRTTSFDPSSSYHVEHFSMHPLHFLEVQRNLRWRDQEHLERQTTHASESSKDSSFFHRTLEAWYSDYHFCSFSTLCNTFRSHLNTVFANPAESRYVILLRFWTKIQHEFSE